MSADEKDPQAPDSNPSEQAPPEATQPAEQLPAESAGPSDAEPQAMEPGRAAPQPDPGAVPEEPSAPEPAGSDPGPDQGQPTEGEAVAQIEQAGGEQAEGEPPGAQQAEPPLADSESLQTESFGDPSGDRPQLEVVDDPLPEVEVDIQEDDQLAETPPQISLAGDASSPDQPLPVAGGPGSQPAPFDPRQAPTWQALLAEYERELAAIGEVPAAAILHYESGRIWEEKLAQPRNAWQSYNRAFQLQPLLLPNIRAARRLASQVGNWNVTVQIIDSEIEATGDSQVQAHLYHSRGLVLEEKLGQLDEARKSYDAALAAAPDNVEILRQIERLAISTGDWKTVLEIREQLLSLLNDPAAIVQLLLSSARIQQVHFEDNDQAEQLYLQVLERDPDNRQAIRAMRMFYTDSKRYEQLLQVLHKEAQFTADPVVATNLYYRAARVYREQMGDEEHAIEALKKAAGLSPSDHMILGEMAQLYENLMRWQELVEVYEKQVQLITDRQELVSLFFKLGNIWEEKLFNEDRAIPNYKKVVELNPNYLPALQALGKLFYRKGQWDDLVEMYEVEIRETPEAKQRATKLYKLAEILEERLSRDEEAIQKFEHCLELNPGFLPALKALGRLYTKYNRWESLIQMYENELDVTPDHDQQVFLLDKVGSLWEEKLNNIDKAIATYQRILENTPNYLPAIRTLGKLFVRADRWEDLIRINELEAQLINDQKQVISLLHRNGEIYEEKLNDKDKAIDTYKEVLTLAPAYLPALQSLGRLYFIKGLWDDLIEMYRQEIEVSSNESQQITLLYKIGELFEEKLVQEDSAIEAYREVLKIRTGNFPAMKALIRIYSNKRDWENLLEILEQEATVLEDPNQKTISLFRVAEIWETQLNRPDQAIETLQRILQVASDHAPSIQSLIRLYTNSKDWRELLVVHERELQQTSSEASQVETLFRIAEIYVNEVNDLVRAAETYEKILTLLPGHMPSLEALERIYLAQRSFGPLVRVYEALAEKAIDPSLVVSLHSIIADIKENRLQPPQNAAENHLKILEHQPTHPEAARALDDLYHKFGSWQGLRALYEREIRRVATAAEALDLCMRIADLAETRLDQPQIAIHYYSEVLRLSPDYLPAIKALKRIHAQNNDSESMIRLLDQEGQVTRDPHQAITTLLEAGGLYRDQFNDPTRAIECFFKVLERDAREVQAFSQLEELLIGQQDWERLAVLYRNRVGVTDDSRAMAELQLKLGNLLLQRLERSQDAAESYREVLRINPSHLDALSALAGISFDAENWDEAIQLSTRILELANDQQILGLTHHRLGVIYQEKKPELDRAVSHFTKATDLVPSNVDALQRMRTIHSARQHWTDAIGVLSKLIEVDVENRSDHMLEKAQLYETGLSEPDKAVDVYRQIQQQDPSNTAVIQKLGELYDRLERWADLVEAYQAFISLLPPDRTHEAIPLHLRVGSLYSEHLDNGDKAILEFKRVVEIEPGHVEAHIALANLYGRTGLYYANAVDEHRKLLDLNPFRIDSYHELRRIFEEQRAFDKVFCVCSVLHYLRAADQNEEFFYGENSSKAPEKTSERLTPEEIERLLIHPKERGIVRAIMKLLGPHLTKLYPPDLAKHGVGKGDRTRPDDPLRSLADGLVASLGEVSYELYRSTQPTHQVAIENTSPQSMIVGDGLVKRTQVKEQRFALGRAIKRIMDGSFLASTIGATELSKLIAAAVQPYHPSSPVATYPSQLPEDMVKKVNKALPRKSRKTLDELLRQHAPELARVPDYEAYIQGAEHSSIRAGLALSNDLANAVMHLSREIPELDGKRFTDGEQIISALSRHASLSELLRFAVSEEYFILRTRLKLSIIS